jgi:hypothetical protein
MISDMALTLARGGGVFVCKDAGFRMNAGEIQGNRALGIGPEEEGSGSGGGVFVGEGGSFELYRGNIAQNSAVSCGGGIAGKGSITVYGGEIRSNSARSSGGGILVEARGRCLIKGGILAGNVTRGGGGAIHVVETGELSFMGGLAVLNQAAMAGRAMMVDGTAVIAGGYIKGMSDAENARIARKIHSGDGLGFPSTDCAICLGENGHLTLSGGDLCGPVGALKKDQIVDTRDPARNGRIREYCMV